MKEVRVIMGMPVTVEIVGAGLGVLEKVFAYFTEIDNRFSTYRDTSEISQINRGELSPKQYSPQMQEVFKLAQDTKLATNGYFDIKTPKGNIDPSGLVKGWAIRNAAELIRKEGFKDFWVEAGGDIQVSGKNSQGIEWRIGIRNPFDRQQIIKIVHLSGQGIATSGDYIRGAHIYDPHTGAPARSGLASLTIIGPDVYEADRFATAAYAMGDLWITFIGKMKGFEGYAVSRDGFASMTSGFSRFEKKDAVHETNI